MKPLAADGLRLWAIVAATVRPFAGRTIPSAKAATLPAGRSPPRPKARTAPTPSPPRHLHRPPQDIEPGRRRRLISEREALAGCVDLHGLGQDRARAALTAFVLRGHDEGRRAILVITGKGALGDGVLRRRVPEWLAAPPLRAVVAGLSEAHSRHGGAGALYVALKRKGRG